MKATIDTYSGLTDCLIFAIFSLTRGYKGQSVLALEERGQMSSRQEVKVEHKCQ